MDFPHPIEVFLRSYRVERMDVKIGEIYFVTLDCRELARVDMRGRSYRFIEAISRESSCISELERA